MLRFGLALGLIAIATAALPATAWGLAPGHVSALGCINTNDSPAQAICARNGDGLDSPDDIAISPDGRNVYLPSPLDDALTWLNIAPDGSLTYGGCVDDNDPPDGADNCGASTDGLNGVRDAVVSPDGRHVYALGRTDDAIVRFDRASDGSLTPVGCIEDTGAFDACGLATIGMNAPDSLALRPNGRSLYVVTDLDNAVVAFTRDPVTGALTPGACIDDDDDGPELCGGTAPGLQAADDVVVSPDGDNLYVTSDENGDSAIVRFDLVGAPGTPTGGTCIDDVDALESPETCAATAEGLDDIERVAVSRDGRSVYTVAGADGAIAQFDRDSSGALTPVGCIGGDNCSDDAPDMVGAQGVAVSPDDKFVYVAEAGTQALRTFRRATDGSLAPLACVAVSAIAGCSPSGGLTSLARQVVTSPSGHRIYLASSNAGAATFATEEPPECVGRATSGAPGASQTVPLDCTDLNGDALAIQIVEPPGNGTLGAVDQASDTVVYTPNAGFAGVDSFVFQAVADGAASDPVTATVAVGSATGPAGPAGPTGPAGQGGPAGPPGQDGTPAIALLALLGQDTFSATSGRRATFRIAATAPGRAQLRILKGRRVLVTLRKSLTKAGRTSIAWNGKVRRGRRTAPLAAGRYTLSLQVEGRDGQKATDSARLTVRRRAR
jgi:6-phosphogluconolactonase (cycloisomerase 2 family)